VHVLFLTQDDLKLKISSIFKVRVTPPFSRCASPITTTKISKLMVKVEGGQEHRLQTVREVNDAMEGLAL
jgi:hypothetical protein